MADRLQDVEGSQQGGAGVGRVMACVKQVSLSNSNSSMAGVSPPHVTCQLMQQSVCFRLRNHFFVVILCRSSMVTDAVARAIQRAIVGSWRRHASTAPRITLLTDSFSAAVC